MSARIALYWHNGLGLGHLSVSAKICRALLQTISTSAIAGIAGSWRGLELVPRGLDLLKLPSYLAYDLESGFQIEPVLPMTERELFCIREDLIATFLRGFRPHVLHVDYHPQGTHGELTTAIKSSPGTKKTLGLRGVLASREETNVEFFSSRMCAFVDEYFSKIYIYNDPRVFRIEDYYDVPSLLVTKMEYVGYLDDPLEFDKAEARGILGLDLGARIIVASMGGGQGAYPIWQSILDAMALHHNRFDLAYLAAGPYLEEDAYENLQMETTHNPKIKLERFLDKLPIWMKASDLFIGAGGGNSLSEVMATRSNALIIPRQINDAEQEIHAKRLAELGIIRVVSRAQVLNHQLHKLLDQCLSEPLVPNMAITMGGARKIAQLIKSLL